MERVNILAGLLPPDPNIQGWASSVHWGRTPRPKITQNCPKKEWDRCTLITLPLGATFGCTPQRTISGFMIILLCQRVTTMCPSYFRSGIQVWLQNTIAEDSKTALRPDGDRVGIDEPKRVYPYQLFPQLVLQAGVQPLTRLFGFHYDFWKNPKSPNLYNIARQAGGVDWTTMNFSKKTTHTHWCFINRPKLTVFSVWREVNPSTLLIMPNLSDKEKDLYAALVDTKLEKLGSEEFRDKDWLLSLWGGGNSLFSLSFFIYILFYNRFSFLILSFYLVLY